MPDRTPASRENPRLLAKISRPIAYGETITSCGVPGCPNPHRTTNLCVGHYQQFYKWRRKQEQDGVTRIRQSHGDALRIFETYQGGRTDSCLVPGCDRPFLARGLCKLHYTRAARRAKGNDQ